MATPIKIIVCVTETYLYVGSKNLLSVEEEIIRLKAENHENTT